MRRLFPDPVDSVTVSEAYGDPSRAPHDGRPWVYLVMIASADGATAVDGVSGPLGGAGDKAVFATMREQADVVLVGAGTARAEHYGPPKRADLRIAMISRALNVDWDSPLMTSGQVLIVTTETAGPVPDHIPTIRTGERERRPPSGARRAASARIKHRHGGGRTIDQRAADRARPRRRARAHVVTRARGGHVLAGRSRIAHRVRASCRSCTSSKRTGRSSCATSFRRRDRGRSASARCSCAAA